MIQNSWSELKGEALESHQFRLSGDPRIEWKIVTGQVDPDDLSSIVQYYKFESEKLPCCLCGRAVHHGGAVILLRDLTFRLIGQCCGRAHFKDHWAQSTNAFRGAERSANDRINARKILALANEFESQSYSLRPIIDYQESARLRLSAAFGDTFRPLANELLRSAGRLSYIERIGNVLSDQGATASLRNVQRDTERLSGVEMFTLSNRRKKLDLVISEFKDNFCQIRTCLDKDFSLTGKLKKHTDIIAKIIRIVDLYNDSIGYLDNKNAEIINFWMQKTGIEKTIQPIEAGWAIKCSSYRKVVERVSLPKARYPQIFVQSDV